MSNCPDANLILDFFEGRLRNGDHLTIADMHQFSDFEIETDHLSIQWLFPNRHQSPISPDAPHLTEEAIFVVRNSKAALQSFRTSLAMMTSFYERNSHWIRHRDHNHLRISRIIETTRAILGTIEATAFFDFISERVGNIVSDRVYAIWRSKL